MHNKDKRYVNVTIDCIDGNGMRGIPLRCPYLYTIKRNKSVRDFSCLQTYYTRWRKACAGICGFFGKKKNKREIVEKMKEKLVHRGPDAQGSFVNDSVALGFRRLSIIDLEGGLQPMKSSSQNLTVVFNGEIYNYQELREQMEREKKILFVTRSDTETLVNGLEAYGPAFVEQLRGMFAFAVWNEKKEELMLARDFFGIKPLFYTVVDGNFVFASEIKSILQFPGVPKKLNERALEQYLSFQYSVLEETFFEGIYRLPPGCMLFYRQGKYEICRYFQPKLQPEAGVFAGGYGEKTGERA